MRTKGFKKLITLVVGVLYVLTAFVTSGIFYVASAETPVSLYEAIQGYNATTNSFSYIYLGEYPQRRVLEVTNGLEEIDGIPTGKTGWDGVMASGSNNYANFTYSEESKNVENTIKGYIKDLNEQYYKVYLKRMVQIRLQFLLLSYHHIQINVLLYS